MHRFEGTELVFAAALGVNGAVVIVAREEGFAVDPGAFDEDGVGKFGNTALVAVEHGDEEISGSGADFGTILINAGKAAGGVGQVKVNETSFLRNADLHSGEPIEDLLMVADDDFGFIFGEPFGEVFLGPFTVGDEVHGDAIGGDDALLVDEESTGVVVFNAFIDAGAEGEPYFVVAEFAESAEGCANRTELVIDGAVQARPGEGITERDGREIWPFKAHVSEGDGQRRDEQTIDVAAV